MKSKKLKKRIIIAAVSLVVIFGLVIGVLVWRQSSHRAFVQPVEMLNMPYISTGITFSGSVYESAQQKVFASSDKVVDEVFVSKGDKVSKGDRLFQYDTTILELSVEEKELTVTICENSLASEQKKLEFYQSIVPYVEPETEAPAETEETANPEATEPEVQEPAEEEPADAEQHYTAQQKADLITDQELAIKRARTALDSANEGLTEAKNALAEAVVTAKIDGTVTDIQDPSSADSSAPFCTVVGNSGVTVKGYVGEFDLSSVKAGDTLEVTSYMTGAVTQAEVLSVGDYPSDSSSANYMNGNPNTSCYEITAFMDQSEGFDIGESVELSLVTYDQTESFDDQTIILDRMYVRSDENGAYVMKDSEGKLVRQSVTAQSAADGYVKITEGLTMEDMIAFPYGSKGREGVPTTTEQQGPSLF